MQTKYCCLFFFAIVVIACAFRSQAQEQSAQAKAVATEPSAFKISSTVIRGDDGLEGATFVLGDRAVEFDSEDENKPKVVFDLKAMSWRNCDSGVVTTLEDAEKWATASLEKTKESRAKRAKDIPPELLSFIDLTIDPKFDVEVKDDVLKLNAAALRYEIHNNKDISEEFRAKFYVYDKLNAYHKAMVQKKITPHLQLEADRIMAERKFFPADLTMTMKAGKEEVKVRTKIAVSPLTNDELARVKKAVDLESKATQ